MTTRCGADDDLCGRLSAIPPCCRAWLAVWTAFLSVPAHQALIPRRPVCTRAMHPILQLYWGYVACPGCRHCGARIVVRACPCPVEQA
jgi:hypothetical protein